MRSESWSGRYGDLQEGYLSRGEKGRERGDVGVTEDVPNGEVEEDTQRWITTHKSHTHKTRRVKGVM